MYIQPGTSTVQGCPLYLTKQHRTKLQGVSPTWSRVLGRSFYRDRLSMVFCGQHHLVDVTTDYIQLNYTSTEVPNVCLSYMQPKSLLVLILLLCYEQLESTTYHCNRYPDSPGIQGRPFKPAFPAFVRATPTCT